MIGDLVDKQKQIISPLRAIKQFCFECNGSVRGEAEKCTSPRCPLFPFRLGKNPYHTREMSDEQKREAAERLRRMREAKAVAK